MAEDSQPGNPGGDTPLATESTILSLQEQHAEAQSVIRGLHKKKKEMAKEIKAAKKETEQVKSEFTTYKDSVKRKHDAELRDVAKGFRGPSPLYDIGNLKRTESTQDAFDDISTRSQKRARIQAPVPITSGIPAMPQPGDFPPRAQNCAADMMNEDAAAPHSRPARARDAFPICIFCYMNHLRCDAGEPCYECAQRGRTCKRAKCANFEGGECRNPKCLRAHEEDSEQYANLRDAGRVSQKKKDPKGGKKGGGGDGGGGLRVLA